MNGSTKCAMRIGAFELRPDRSVLLHTSGTHHLEPKVCDVICRLAKEQGEVVSRETLLDDVWGKSFGADESLTRAISILRKIFKQDNERLYIETVPKKGYRLTAAVSELTAQDRLDSDEAGYHGHVPDTMDLPTAPPPEASATLEGLARGKPVWKSPLWIALAVSFILSMVLLLR